jgi:hypothetical protein
MLDDAPDIVFGDATNYAPATGPGKQKWQLRTEHLG